MTIERIAFGESYPFFSESSEYICDSDKIKGYLENLSIQYPTSVIKKLGNGDHVRNGNSIYRIDNIENICNKVRGNKNIPFGKIPLTEIYNSFKVPQNKQVKDGDFSFSEILGENGMCFECAVLTHLFAQENKENFPFLITEGYLFDEQGEQGLHAYNLIFRRNELFLLDSSNPLNSESQLVHYIAPVVGIKPYGNEIIVENSWKQGRQYSIL
ncbi:MAG TPA: hypothetical protein PLK34_00125 [Candidatus Pacearchaeota archaeon]|nr:hypothetical protein [Candidatus Pacearchaeota archaeon]